MPKATVKMTGEAEFALFLDKHGQTATAAINQYLENCGCKTNDDRLGALGVLLKIGLGMGDGLQAIELDRRATGKRN